MKRACLLTLVVAACSDPEAPAPTIASITPEAICGINTTVSLAIIGDGFDDDAEVFLERAGGGDRITYSAGEASTFHPGLIVVLDNAGEGAPGGQEPPHTYDVVVRNPDGQEARLPAAYTKYASITVAQATPAVGARGASVDVTLTGGGFYDDVEVRLGVAPAAPGGWITPTSSTAATVTFDLAGGINAGSYSILVRNRGGCTNARDNLFVVQ